MIRRDEKNEQDRWRELDDLLGLTPPPPPVRRVEEPADEPEEPKAPRKEKPFPLDIGEPVMVAKIGEGPDDEELENADVGVEAEVLSEEPVSDEGEEGGAPASDENEEQQGRRRRGRRRGRRGKRKGERESAEGQDAGDAPDANEEAPEPKRSERSRSRPARAERVELSAPVEVDREEAGEEEPQIVGQGEFDAEEPAPRDRRPRRGHEPVSDDSWSDLGDTDNDLVEDEPPARTSALEEEDDEEDITDFSNWNVPSWEELIASLYRPDR